jgi:hypothetical protein
VVGAADRRIVVVVHDKSRWYRAVRGPGYGLKIVHECMAGVCIRHDEGGTAVTMTSRSVPLLDCVDAGDEYAVEEIAAREGWRLRP